MDAVPNCREIERSQRIKETSGQTTEAAVTKTHVVFLATENFRVESEFMERVLHLVENSCAVEAV